MKKKYYCSPKRSILFVIGLLLVCGCTQESRTPLEELKMIGVTMKQHSHVEYSYRSKKYRSYTGDTVSRSGKVYFEANPNDTLLGMNFYHKSKHYDNFYNGNYIINMEPKDSIVFKKPLCDYEGGHMTVYPFLELSYGAIQLFLTDKMLDSQIDSLVRRDVKVGNKLCTYFSFWANQKFVSTHKKYDRYNMKIELVVNKADHLPVFYSQHLLISRKMNTDFVDNKVFFSDYSFDVKYPEEMFSIENVPDFYQWDKFKKYMKILPVGKVAPDWTLPEIGGDSISLSALKGKVVLLDFWFIGCGGCIQSIPVVNRLYENYKNKGFEVVGINCFSNKKNKIQEYVTTMGMKYRNVWKGESICDEYIIKAAPVFYLIDRQGKIVFSFIGLDSKKLEEAVGELMKDSALN
ncbi:TlpA family protein disulfide reductase [Marinilabiliaceae bacterium JC017]|nr:TlpA family protein disulfide reductase [Marinilabiliaceae bacterium JC017]